MLGIVVVVYNLPSNVFLLQQEAIKLFCKDEYEVVIVDNSSDDKISQDIFYHSGVLGLKYIKTFSGSMGSSDSHSFAANFSFEKLNEGYETMLYLDHDCVPVRDFSVNKILDEDRVVAGIGQTKSKTYMWPGCVMISLERIDRELVDFSTNHELGLDTGGNLYKIIEKYGNERCIFFNETYHENVNFNGKHNYFSMINNKMFLHFVNSSNWRNDGRHEERINSLVNITKEIAGL